MMLSTAPPVVRDDLPPSCKLVWAALDELREASHQDLLEATQLPRRTLGDALDRLDDVGVLESDATHQDRRQTVYRLKSTDDAG